MDRYQRCLGRWSGGSEGRWLSERDRGSRDMSELGCTGLHQ